MSAQQRLTLIPVSLPLQPCRTAPKAPTGTRGTKLCTVKTSSDDICFWHRTFLVNDMLLHRSSCVSIYIHQFSVVFWILNKNTVLHMFSDVTVFGN